MAGAQQQFGHHFARIADFWGDKNQTLDWVDQVDAAAESLQWDTITTARMAKQTLIKGSHAKRFFDNTTKRGGQNLHGWTPVLHVAPVAHVPAILQVMADPLAAPPIEAVAARAETVRVFEVAAVNGGLRVAMIDFFGKKQTYEDLVNEVAALKQQAGEPAVMFMQRVQEVLHDVTIKVTNRTAFQTEADGRAFAHYQQGLEAMYFYSGLKADIRKEVATTGLEEHAQVIQRAINMEAAQAAAIASKSQGVPQQQAACSSVSNSGPVAGSAQCEYCGIFDHDAKVCKRCLADEKGGIFRPRHPDWPMTKKSWKKEGGKSDKKKKPKAASASATSTPATPAPPQQGRPAAPDSAELARLGAYFQEKYRAEQGAAMNQPPPAAANAANAIWGPVGQQFPAIMGPTDGCPPAPAFPGWPAPGNY
jgi:hypothetical protein